MFALLASMMLTAQHKIAGKWEGILNVQGTELPLIFNIQQDGGLLVATMDSPQQGAKGIPVDQTRFEDGWLDMQLTKAGIHYRGQLIGDTVKGVFKQGGLEIKMDLAQGILRRYQEPEEPLPYPSEDIIFENPEAGIKLAGTFATPVSEGPWPAVVLISGSGPQNRDEELMRHKPFLVLSDYLVRSGIAVLRFDDRGVAESEGDFATATTADFATDAASALAWLKTREGIDTSRVGLIGHSEGALVGPMVAASGVDVDFLVLMAGTGIRGDSLLLLQQGLIVRASGVPEDEAEEARRINRYLYDVLLKVENPADASSDLRSFLQQQLGNGNSFSHSGGLSTEQFIEQQMSQLVSPWMHYFVNYDPSQTLKKVRCPVLAINGEKDLQVPADVNLQSIQQALVEGGNKHVKTKSYPDLNHLFQECETGLPSEYVEIEQTISPLVLLDIAKWINAL